MSEGSRRRQVAKLRQMGLSRRQRRSFFMVDQAIVYYFATTSGPAIALLQCVGGRLRSGIIEINDPRGGIKNWVRFQAISRQVAVAFGADELEIFGAAIIDPRLEQLFIDWGYNRATDNVPEELGGGTMEIVTKTILLSKSNGGSS